MLACRDDGGGVKSSSSYVREPLESKNLQGGGGGGVYSESYRRSFNRSRRASEGGRKLGTAAATQLGSVKKSHTSKLCIPYL